MSIKLNNKKFVLQFVYLISFLILLDGCATSYKKLGKNGGYSDEKVTDRVYKVAFEGNTRTSDEKVHKYFLRRSAEIALDHHFPYFIVIESEDITKSSVVTAEGSPLTKAKITAMSYSATTAYSPTIQKTINKHLIEGKIALFNEGEQPVNALIVEDVLKNTAN